MPLKMKYFVLNPRSKSHDDPFAKASRKAMRAYALSICAVDMELSRELVNWSNFETDRDLSIADHEKSYRDRDTHR